MQPTTQERYLRYPIPGRVPVPITDCRAQPYKEASNSGGTLNVHDPPGIYMVQRVTETSSSFRSDPSQRQHDCSQSSAESR
jgi:hypothetical protein